MEVVFVSNFLNHHQYPVAQRLYELTGGSYRFVEVMAMPEWIKKSGYPEFHEAPFLIEAWKSRELKNEAIDEINKADYVCFSGVESLPLVKARLQLGKYTVEIGERWLKRGLVNILSPRLLKVLFYYRILRWRPDVRLCASAYAAGDMEALGLYKGRCYKWGYFPTVAENQYDGVKRSVKSKVKILWVARFLNWKHPEKALAAAKYLYDNGIDFEMNMYGSGPYKNVIADMIADNGLDNIIKLRGNLPNVGIREEMGRHDIFLFTSDKNEGWGAVVNEAMSQGCMVLASNSCGSVPFLITNGVTGLTYDNDSQDELNRRLLFACKNPTVREAMATRGQNYIREVWSPDAAACRLLAFVRSFRADYADASLPIDGPCSPAYAIM